MVIYAFPTHNCMENPLVLKEKGHLAFPFPKLHDSQLNAIN